ncbi:unnamed protein product [Paramecium sonneborni]|uniref:Uncharacterized protein n=1 Tax=Paramecium sonneborni TaxID=65129 RepID=A0A8S1K0X8_9CILI|nr:unnamed protein product [Paramecium sonneborni]
MSNCECLTNKQPLRFILKLIELTILFNSILNSIYLQLGNIIYQRWINKREWTIVCQEQNTHSFYFF